MDHDPQHFCIVDFYVKPGVTAEAVNAALQPLLDQFARDMPSIFGNWSTDSIVYARTAPPVNVVTGQNTFGAYLSGATGVQRPNLVPGVPIWIPFCPRPLLRGSRDPRVGG